MTLSFAARLEGFSYDESVYCVLLIEAAVAKPAEESHGEALGRDSAFRRMVQFRGSGVPPMPVCSPAQLDDALGLTTTAAEMLADAHSGRNGRWRERVDVLDSEERFAFVAAVGAALLGAAIGGNTPSYGAVFRVEGQDPPFQILAAMIGVLQS
jgi:hypothetical protein